MKIKAAERGDRPSVMTKARVIAPQAATYLAKLLEEKEFADSAVIVIDWIGDFAWHGEGDMPIELRLPSMVIVVEKHYPQYSEDNRLKLEYVLELEEMFGQDNATKDDLHEVVQILEDQMRVQEERRRSK